MPKFKLNLEIEEVYTYEHVVEAENYEEAVKKTDQVELDRGVGSEDTEVFKWDYSHTNFFIDPYGREQKYNEHG